MGEERKEKIIRSARQVFLKYGFRRVSMNDLAEAAQISRPTLYLLFPSKEDVFTAVIARSFQEALDEIRQDAQSLPTPAEKLTFAFEIWCVRNFELVQASPEAKDLLESGHQFASEVMDEASTSFTNLLAEVLQPLVKTQEKMPFTALQIARILTNAVVGLKIAASDVAELRQSIAGLLTITLASLQSD